jgi:hypothetical protein
MIHRMTHTISELVELSGKTNEANGYNGYRKAHEDGYGVDYLAKKDLLEVSELAEALDELRHGHSADEIYTKDGKLEGYQVIDVHGLDTEETLANLVGKIEYNARRADTAKSGVKGF